MAPPTRFNSVRGASRPLRKSSFRDDTSLVALRYEKTVAAAPPLHVVPRQMSGNTTATANNICTSISTSTTTSTTTTTTTAASSLRKQPLHRSPSASTTTSSSSSHHYSVSCPVISTPGTASMPIRRATCTGNGPGAGTARGPIIVAPPPRLSVLPIFAPPTEKHPALRSPLPCLEEWKRDSGHAAAGISPSPPPLIMVEDKRAPRLVIKSGSRSSSISQDEDDCFVEKPTNLTKNDDAISISHVEHIPFCPSSQLDKGTAASGTDITATATGTSTDSVSPIKSCSPPSPPPSTSHHLHLTTAASITAADFLPASISPPSSPRHKRQSLRIPLWSGRRDGPLQRPPPKPTTPSSSPATAPASAPASAPAPAPASAADNHTLGWRWNSSLYRYQEPRSLIPVSAKHQPHQLPPPVSSSVSPAKSPSPSSRQMSSLSSAKQQPDGPAPPPPTAAPGPLPAFSPLGVSISTDNLLDEDFISSLVFSKRGSLMFNSESLSPDNDTMDRVPITESDRSATPTQPCSLIDTGPRPVSSATSNATGHDDTVRRSLSHITSPTPDIAGLMTLQVEQESQKVRLLYASGETSSPVRHSYCERLEPTPEVVGEEEAEQEHNDDPVPYEKSKSLPAPVVVPVAAATADPVAPATTADAALFPLSNGTDSYTCSPQKYKKPIAPRAFLRSKIRGFEDWDDLDGALVDRYGFIGTPRIHSRLGTPTEMRSAHFSPRRRNVLTKRDPMGFTTQSGRRLPSRKLSARSLNTQNSDASIISFRSSRSVMRQAGNLLPQNRNRRWMDEAGDMLTVSPNLQDSVEEARVEKISEALKRKEIDRCEKWRRMARVTRKGDQQGHGMEFDFDTKNPKLIERTWKGIPDRWRAVAWWSFLATSAKEHTGSATERDIIASFHRLQNCASADDIQIDLDVPRTISRHIMFRRRYRGGQRLLFRVLHALSLYFSKTGYVQGMASLAATLLCYYDEEKCFVMLVRMWQLRGLERLYQPGFEGLMAALREFETTWLNKDVAAKLTDISIDSTAYGTRWYLTLFNLSIPFAAQLRVWDVFLLLGVSSKSEPPRVDGSQHAALVETPSLSAPLAKQNGHAIPPMPSPLSLSLSPSPSTPTPPDTSLDVLHATSAALIQALREVLLDSDFENAMKALTAWIPIKDEDLLMKVTRAEWRTQLKRRG